jgi:methionyl-tRNA synthetase
MNPVFDPCDHEYLNFKGAKLSKSRGAFVEVTYFLSKYDPDALRFYLTAVPPETCDTEAGRADTLTRSKRSSIVRRRVAMEG